MLRFFWKFRYFNLLVIFFCLLLCIISFDNFKVYFDSERIIELVDVDKDVIEKSIDDNTSPIGILKATPWGLLFIFIFAVIASIFVKKNEEVSDRIN